MWWKRHKQARTQRMRKRDKDTGTDTVDISMKIMLFIELNLVKFRQKHAITLCHFECVSLSDPTDNLFIDEHISTNKQTRSTLKLEHLNIV